MADAQMREKLRELFDGFPSEMRSDFEAAGRRLLESLHTDVGLAHDVSRYVVDSGGKRLRSMTVLLAAGACGLRDRRCVDLAAAIELLHTATLLHDDVVDMSVLRRSRPTANQRWDNQSSVLVGDFLYAKAFQLLVAIGDTEVMRILSDVTCEIAEGELMQIALAGQLTVTEEEHLEVVRRKTAALFSASTQSAAALAAATSAQVEALRVYGTQMGVMFQVVDDLLDYLGETAKTGKKLGDDLAEGKLTLPLIWTLRYGSKEQQDCVARAVRAGREGRGDGREREQLLADTLAAVSEGGGFDYARGAAEACLKRSLAALDAFPAQDAWRLGLARLAEFAFARQG